MNIVSSTGGGVNFYYEDIYRRADIIQASKYMNWYHFHTKSIAIGYLFHPKSI